MWSRMRSLRVKVRGQLGQLKGLIPVCAKECATSLSLWANLEPQIRHWNPDGDSVGTGSSSTPPQIWQDFPATVTRNNLTQLIPMKLSSNTPFVSRRAGSRCHLITAGLLYGMARIWHVLQQTSIWRLGSACSCCSCLTARGLKRWALAESMPGAAFAPRC